MISFWLREAGKRAEGSDAISVFCDEFSDAFSEQFRSVLFSSCWFHYWWRPGSPRLGFLSVLSLRGPFSAALENGFSRRRSTKQVFQILETLPLVALALFAVVVCVLSQSGG